jgi:hypothetical protein
MAAPSLCSRISNVIQISCRLFSHNKDCTFVISRLTFNLSGFNICTDSGKTRWIAWSFSRMSVLRIAKLPAFQKYILIAVTFFCLIGFPLNKTVKSDNSGAFELTIDVRSGLIIAFGSLESIACRNNIQLLNPRYQ